VLWRHDQMEKVSLEARPDDLLAADGEDDDGEVLQANFGPGDTFLLGNYRLYVRESSRILPQLQL